MSPAPLDTFDRYELLFEPPDLSLDHLQRRRTRARRRRQVAAGAGTTAALAGFVAAMVWVLPIGSAPSPEATQIAAAPEGDAATAPATTVEPLGVGPEAVPPVEFTACNNGMEVTSALPDETVTIPPPDGPMTIVRGRTVVTQGMSDVSDPRFDGTWRMSWNEDDYRGRSGSANIVTVTWRIETDEGAWQGSDTWARHAEYADDEPQFVLTGEGAYEGLTTIMKFTFDEECPNAFGLILDLGVPEPEATFPTS